MGVPDVRGHSGGRAGPDREAVSEDHRPQRYGDRAAPDQRAHRASELPEVRTGLWRAVFNRRGMEMLPRRLAASLRRTHVELDAPVVRVSRTRDRRYDVTIRRSRRVVQHEFDAVVIALPYNRLQDIEWEGERLRRAMATTCRALRPPRSLPAHLDPLRPAVLAACDHGFLGHARRVRGLLRLRRISVRGWCDLRRVGLAAGWRRCAVVLQSRRSDAGGARSRIAA